MATAPNTNPSPEANLIRYVIDPRKGSFTAQAFATGMLSAFGHSPRIAIREFSGEARFAQSGTSIESAHLQLTVQARSLEVTDDIREKDRQEIHRQMYDEVLETDRFPEITYECSHASASGNEGVSLLLEDPQEIARTLLSCKEISVTQGEVGTFLGKDQTTISRWVKSDLSRTKRAAVNA